MTLSPMRLAATVVRSWTWLYTVPLDREIRWTRRAEIASDLWADLHDESAESAWRRAARIIGRAWLGLPDDVLWVAEQLRPLGWSRRRAESWRGALLMTAGLIAAAISHPGAAAPPRFDVVVHASGWVPVAGERDQVHVIPSVALRVTNGTDRRLRQLQLNAVFETADRDPQFLGTAFSWLLPPGGLAAGATGDPVIVRPLRLLPAAAAPPPADGFPPARVKLFVKHAGTWTLLGVYPLARAWIQPAGLAAANPPPVT